MLRLASTRPTHITEIVPPHLPHRYGYVDAAAVGGGGVWLPCTGWVQPTIWRIKWPKDIEQEVRKRDGSISNSDVEAAVVFIQDLMLDHLLKGRLAGQSAHTGSDNSPAVHWNRRMASRANHRAPERFLRIKAILQRWTRCGPQDITHYAGSDNLLGDVPSRSYEEGFPEGEENNFLKNFSLRFPLPPQLGSWQLVPVPPGIVSLTTLILRGQSNSINPERAWSVNDGATLPPTLANALFSPASRAPTSTWNKATCSWPLLLPSGKEDTMQVQAVLLERPSKKRFAGSHNAWSPEDLQTLAAQLQGQDL